MKLFNWFCKLTSKHWEFSVVNWLFFCYFHFRLLLVGLKYQLLTHLKNYSTKKKYAKINHRLFIYESINRLYFEQKKPRLIE